MPELPEGFVAVPDTAVVNLFMLYDTSPGQSGFFYQKSGFDLTALTALTSAVKNAWADNVMDWLSAQCQFIGAGGTGLRTFDDVFTFVNQDPPVLGGVASNALPNQNAFAIRLDTGKRGKGNVGRVSISGIANSDRDGVNNITAELGNHLVDAVTAVRLAAQGLGWQPVLVHRRRNKIRLNPREVTIITGESYTSLVIGSMDSRKPGRGGA